MNSRYFALPVLRLAVDELKICPLCSCVNAQANLECVMCRWHGQFSHDPDEIEVGLAELLDACPELGEFCLPMASKPEPGWRSRLRLLLSRWRRIDIQA